MRAPVTSMHRLGVAVVRVAAPCTAAGIVLSAASAATRYKEMTPTQRVKEIPRYLLAGAFAGLALPALPLMLLCGLCDVESDVQITIHHTRK